MGGRRLHPVLTHHQREEVEGAVYDLIRHLGTLTTSEEYYLEMLLMFRRRLSEEITQVQNCGARVILTCSTPFRKR